MKKWDEQVIADLLRTLYNAKIIDDLSALDKLINELQLRLFASEKGVTKERLLASLQDL